MSEKARVLLDVPSLAEGVQVPPGLLEDIVAWATRGDVYPPGFGEVEGNEWVFLMTNRRYDDSDCMAIGFDSLDDLRGWVRDFLKEELPRIDKTRKKKAIGLDNKVREIFKKNPQAEEAFYLFRLMGKDFLFLPFETEGYVHMEQAPNESGDGLVLIIKKNENNNL